MSESVEVKLARIEEGLVAMRGEMKLYHQQITGPMATQVREHDRAIVRIRTHGLWISGLVGTASSWLGLKLFGKG